MGTGAAGAFSSSSSAYVGWKEAFMSSDRGRREVHYYLKRKDGASDLVVVGKEKNPGHINFRYAVQNRFLISGSSPSLFLKLRSRREVIHWLHSIVQDCHVAVDKSSGFGSFDERDAGFLTIGRPLKDVQMQKMGQYGKQLAWLGSSWMCKKKRTHYESFCRNGFKISVNDFVFVLAEDQKRLVAHLEDMYEDSQGSKMVVVRWFHRIDEVDIDLPHKFSDREIFFSLCLQDLNIECIDGLAIVLSPLHFDKYMNEGRDSWVHPFVCQRLFDDCDIKPFDITQIKGYWTQDLLRRMFSTLGTRTLDKSHSPDHNMNVKELDNSHLISRPRKRLRLLKDSRIDMQHGIKRGAVDNPSLLDGKSNISREGTNVTKKLLSSLPVGCQVEVLSQDSGIRGCWFRASIVKKHKDKIKVRYHDVKDADDEINHLEEWVSSSRIAVDDNLALRINGRTTVRPLPQTHSGRVSWSFDVGSLVDAWWYDGWWEGILIHREADERVRVYFPGEKRDAVFSLGELRHSQEWLGNTWKDLHGRADLATAILSDLDHGEGNKTYDNKTEEASAGNSIPQDSLLHKIEAYSSNSQLDNSDRETDNSAGVQDLSKDKFLAQLQWKSSRKRSRTGHFVEKPQHSQLKKNIKKAVMHKSNQSFLAPSPAKLLKVDHENCKYMGDSLFNSSAAPPVRSLVIMSR